MGNILPTITIDNNTIKINSKGNNDYSKKESFLNQHNYYICNVNNLFIIAICFLLYKDIAKKLYVDTCKDIIPNNEMVSINKIEVDGQKQDYEDIEVRMTATKVLVDNQFFK